MQTEQALPSLRNQCLEKDKLESNEWSPGGNYCIQKEAVEIGIPLRIALEKRTACDGDSRDCNTSQKGLKS
jgi:hypothetical protein